MNSRLALVSTATDQRAMLTEFVATGLLNAPLVDMYHAQ